MDIRPEFEDLTHENISPTLNQQQEEQNEGDELDPLFSQPTVKRALDFNVGEDADSILEPQDNIQSCFDLGDFKEKKLRTKRSFKKPAKFIPSEKKERKVRQAQHVDFQRVMRERKGVGFKPAPMVEKSISSVLQKIKQRKIEVFQKVMPAKEIELDDDSEEDECIKDILDGSRSLNGVKTVTNHAPTDGEMEKDLHSSDKENTCENPLVDETTQPFRAPINDTQDLFVDSGKSFSLGDDSNESNSPAEEITPSAPSLNLQLDSAFADDISSNDEESDKENVDPYPKHLFRGNSTAIGDPVKEFMDEEALEDDSDNDRFQEKDEDDFSDMEENCDYIATDVVEKRHDRERNNLYHQQWQQQQDDAGTEKILEKLNCGTGMKREATYLDDEDADDKAEDEGNESDKDVASDKDEGDESDNDFAYGEDEKGYIASGVTTKKLRQMIPLMFTDKDDVYLSSEDEETERSLSKQFLLKQRRMQQNSKIMSPAENTSTEVFSHIKKINVLPVAKKKKITSFFDPLLVKESSNNFSKSSFLRRASSHPGPSNQRHGPSTGRSYIFGRDDSNSRSSMSLSDDSPSVGQKEIQAKKSGTAKFVSSQGKLSTQHTQTETSYTGKSLFDILKCSSVQTTYDTSDNIVVDDQLQAVFSAFKKVKKHTTKVT